MASVCRAGIVRVKSGTAAKPTAPASPEPLTATVTGRSSTSAPPATIAVTVTSVAPAPSDSSDSDSDSATSGASISMLYCAAARLSLRCESFACPVARSTVTSPEPAGVIVATYSENVARYSPREFVPRDASIARSADTVPLPTVRSASSNPDTASSNTIRTTNGPCTGPPSAGPVSSTRGGRLSIKAVQLAALFTCPSASSATPNGTVSVTSPWNSSATEKYTSYSFSDPEKLVMVAFSTTKSSCTKSVTGAKTELPRTLKLM